MIEKIEGQRNHAYSTGTIHRWAFGTLLAGGVGPHHIARESSAAPKVYEYMYASCVIHVSCHAI